MDEKDKLVEEKPTKTPDEKPGVVVQAVVKIFDPESEEIFVEKRA